MPSLATADVLPCPRAARFLNYKPDSMRTRSIAAIRGTRSALADLLIASRRWIWLIGCSRLDGNPDFCSPTVPLLNAANHRRLIVQAENFKFTPYWWRWFEENIRGYFFFMDTFIQQKNQYLSLETNENRKFYKFYLVY